MTATTARGGGAIPVSVTTRNTLGGSAIPVYGYDTAALASAGGHVPLGGSALPVRVLTAADLIENGGTWRVQGMPQALPVYTAAVTQIVQGGNALAVYPVNGWGSGSGACTGILLPQNLINSPGTVLEGFQASADWTVSPGGSATLTEDLVNVKVGSPSLGVLRTGALSYIGKTVTNLNVEICETLPCRVLIYREAGIGGTLLFRPSSSATFAKWMTNQVNLSNFPGKWSYTFLPATTWTASSGDDLSNLMVRLRVYFSGQAANDDITFDNWQMGVSAQPAILFGFDSIFSTFYTNGYPLFTARNIRGTLYPTADNPNAAGKMTTAQMMTAQSAGWCIGHRSDVTVTLAGLTVGQVEARLASAEATLTALGCTPANLKHCCYPFGFWDANVITALTNQNYRSGRSAASLAGAGTYGLPDYSPYMLDPGLFSLTSAYSLASAKAVIDTAKAQGSIVICLGHEIVNAGAAGNQWLTSNLEQLLDYCIQQHVLPLTMADWYTLQSGTCCVPTPVGW